MLMPTLGRIVLVRSPQFIGELPGIVTAVFSGEGHAINVRVFTNNEDSPCYCAAIQPQDESSEGWGWRWPPRVGTVESMPS
jgi:hypothetical protein